MFDWLKRLFGEGKIRIEFTDESGKEFIAKVPYIGDISTLDQEELKQYVCDQWFVEQGTKIIDYKFIGWN